MACNGTGYQRFIEHEIIPGVLVKSKDAPTRFMSDVRDGWVGREYTGKTVLVPNIHPFTGVRQGDDFIEPVNAERFRAYEHGRRARLSFDAGHRVEYLDGRVFAIVHRTEHCGCTMCLRASRGIPAETPQAA